MIFAENKQNSDVFYPKSCSVSGPFNLKLTSKLTNKEYTFEDLEGDEKPNHILFSLDLSNVPVGEFEASLNCEIRTMLQVGERNVDSNTYYDKSIKNTVYELE